METETVFEASESVDGDRAVSVTPSQPVTEGRVTEIDIDFVQTLRKVFGHLLVEQHLSIEQKTAAIGPVTRESASAIDKYRELQRRLGRTK